MVERDLKVFARAVGVPKAELGDPQLESDAGKGVRNRS